MIKFYPEKQVEDIKGWHWIETDSGAWDGPKKDWETSHKNCIEKYCKDYHTVIQAGGNQGMYPKLLSRIFDHVYTFEPDSLNYETLKLNCPDRNIIKTNAALGKENGWCLVKRLTMQNTGMHKVEFSNTQTPDKSPMYKLDDMIFDRVDLIMLDLEGYEYFALQGALMTIKKFKPVIFIERPSTEIRNLLGGIGYWSVMQSAMDEVFVA